MNWHDAAIQEAGSYHRALPPTGPMPPAVLGTREHRDVFFIVAADEDAARFTARVKAAGIEELSAPGYSTAIGGRTVWALPVRCSDPEKAKAIIGPA